MQFKDICKAFQNDGENTSNWGNNWYLLKKMNSVYNIIYWFCEMNLNRWQYSTLLLLLLFCLAAICSLKVFRQYLTWWQTQHKLTNHTHCSWLMSGRWKHWPLAPVQPHQSTSWHDSASSLCSRLQKLIICSVLRPGWIWYFTSK